MKFIYLLFYFLLTISNPLFSLEEQKVAADSFAAFSLKTTRFYNETLKDQSSIKKLNQIRPSIYLYTDFGGGKNAGQLVVDLQTCGEIASAGWKATLQQEIFINDSANPLSP